MIVPQIRRKSSVLLTMELPDGTKIPSIGISPNHSFKAIPIIRSVATMEKIAEAEEDDFIENNSERHFDLKDPKLSVAAAEDSELVQVRRVRRDRRMSERRLSRNLTTTVLQPSRQDSFIFSSPSVKSFQGSASSSRLARPMSRKDIFFSGSIRNSLVLKYLFFNIALLTSGRKHSRD